MMFCREAGHPHATREALSPRVDRLACHLPPTPTQHQKCQIPDAPLCCKVYVNGLRQPPRTTY
jgi:hypothetical protein